MSVNPETAVGRIMRRRAVEDRIGLSRSTIYSMMSRGEFPPPVKLTSKAVGWPESLIDAWLADRAAVTKGEAA